MKRLKSERFERDSLDVPHIYDLRDGLNRGSVLYVVMVIKYFHTRWRIGKNVLTYSERKQRQLHIVRPGQLMSAALDPARPAKILYGIKGHDHEGL